MPTPPADGAYAALMQSSRVSTPTRAALDARARVDDPAYLPAALDDAAFVTLRALLDCIVPQMPPHVVDLAARIDRILAAGGGNGWRFAALPADPAAYAAGLRTLERRARDLHGTSFVLLAAAGQHKLLSDIAAGRVYANGGQTGDHQLDAAQFRLWFEEVRADAVRLYVSLPQTLAQIGYSGIANGGDGRPKSGFVRVGLGEREDWEPLALPRERA